LSNSKWKKYAALIKTSIPNTTDPKTIFKVPLCDGAL
jgi:hypothetical protein